jgi:hypothetical protein
MEEGHYRFCVDYRTLNEVTEKVTYPQINETLDKLRNTKYLSTIDLKIYYWQVPFAEYSIPLTAFTVPRKKLMQVKLMPFRLHSTPAVFQRLVDRVVTQALEENVFCTACKFATSAKQLRFFISPRPTDVGDRRPGIVADGVHRSGRPPTSIAWTLRGCW